MSDLIARRNRLLGTGTPLFYQDPVNIVRGEGVWLYDDTGKKYLDMYNNVPCVGHCHPYVVKAMHQQAGTLNVHNRYLHEGVLDYAERIVGVHADSIESVVFTCTGTEANEVALSMARLATGGRGIICSNAAYHGNSAEVSKLNKLKQTDTTNAEFRSIPYPQCYRPLKEGLSSYKLTDLYLAEVQAAIDGFEADNILLAGMLMCPILANEGVPDIPDDFMARAATMIREAGGLFIADEVQAGFCRTGKWWGYETKGFVPDIATMGKPMGNGMPLAGVVASTKIVDAFRKGRRYFNTFSSTPLQAAAGMAVLDVIESENLRESVAKVGAYMREELCKFQDRCPPMTEIRGHGLYIGLEWVSDRETKISDCENAAAYVNRLKDKGFLIGQAGALGNVLKIRPPLVFQREHADLFLTAFEETIDEIHG